MDVSCITTQQLVYWPMDVPSSVSISRSKSVSRWLFWADTSRLQNWAQGRYVCDYSYPAGKLTICDRCAPDLLLVSAGGVPGRGDVSYGVGYLRQAGGGTPDPLRLQCVWVFFVVAFWQESQPDVWLWRSIAGCLFIAAFTFLCTANSTPRCFFLGPRREDSWSDIVLPLLRRANSHLWLFWTYSRPGSCRTVPAVPDLLALP